MNLNEMRALIEQIEYKPGWSILFALDKKSGGRPYIQVCGRTQDSRYMNDPTLVNWRGAKAYLSEHMCVNEIVEEAFHLLQRAEIHELKEWFRFDGEVIHSPHQDPRELAVFMYRNPRAINVRENAMSMKEL